MKAKKNFLFKFLDFVERTSNKLPDPFYLFVLLAVITAMFSAFFSLFDISVTHPQSNDVVSIRSVFSAEGIKDAFTTMVDNFINFPPLGVVLATMIGISVADKSGFFEAALRHTISIVPSKLIVITLIFVSVNSSLIADAGLIVLPPLAGLTYKSLGKNPLAGVITSFAAICGGFSANLLVTALDPLLSELTGAAALVIDPEYVVYPTANYYFMIVSTFLVTAVCSVVNFKIVEPRLKNVEVEDDEEEDDYVFNKKALNYSYITFFTLVALLIALVIPENSIFKDESGDLTVLFKSIIPLIIIFFFFCGFVYGKIAGTIKSGKDLVEMMNSGMASMASYIIIAFAAGQFLHYFSWSNLDIVTAVKGATFLKDADISGLPLFFMFLIFCMILNILISSASAKWAILAPVFVPMLMILDVSPEATQLIYRIADSTTNMITPLLPYFPLLIVFAQKYKKDIGIGDLISSLLPFSIFLFLAWSVMLVIWYYAGLPIGPNAGFFIG